MSSDATVPPVPAASAMPPPAPGGEGPRRGGRGRWVLGAVAGVVVVVLGLVVQVTVIVAVAQTGTVPDVGWMTWPSVLLVGVVAALVAQPLADVRWRRRVAAAVPGALVASALTLAGAVEADRMAGVPWTTHLVSVVVQPLVVLVGAGVVALATHVRSREVAPPVREATPPAPGGVPDAD